MSVLDFFKTTPPANTTDNKEIPNGENKNLSDPNATKNKDGKMPGTDETPPNPLDAYAKMFENAANNSDIQAPSFTLDSKVVDEVSGKMNFTQGIDKDLMQKAMSGDPEAFMKVIQSSSQNAYKAAIQHNAGLTDTFINQRSEYEKKQINKGVRDQLTTQALADTPNFQHPVVKKELNRIADQFARANPDASPVEIAEAAKQYMVDLSSAMSPTSPANKPVEKEMDWSKYLSS